MMLILESQQWPKFNARVFWLISWLVRLVLILVAELKVFTHRIRYLLANSQSTQ